MVPSCSSVPHSHACTLRVHPLSGGSFLKEEKRCHTHRYGEKRNLFPLVFPSSEHQLFVLTAEQCGCQDKENEREGGHQACACEMFWETPR